MHSHVLLFAGLGMCACADAHVAPNPRWPQPKLASRPDQPALSSRAPCYCFPHGPTCSSSPFIEVPSDAPDDLPACVDGEICYGAWPSYSNGFDIAHGHCRRGCFHAYARGADRGSAQSIDPAFSLDCAEGESCYLWEMRGFEDTVVLTAGMCIPTPPEP